MGEEIYRAGEGREIKGVNFGKRRRYIGLILGTGICSNVLKRRRWKSRIEGGNINNSRRFSGGGLLKRKGSA